MQGLEQEIEQEIEQKYDHVANDVHSFVGSAHYYTEQYKAPVNILSSFALGVAPAFILGTEKKMLAASILFHTGASLVANYLKAHEYITPFESDMIEYFTSSGIFVASCESYIAHVTNSPPVAFSFLINNMGYSAENLAKSFAFGVASIPSMIASSETAKLILRNIESEELYPAAPASTGVITALKYMPAMYTKYSFYPLNDQTPFANSKIYFGAGMIQGTILTSFSYLFTQESDFSFRNFTKDLIGAALTDGVNAWLYAIPGHYIEHTKLYEAVKDKVGPMAYVPIAGLIEDLTLVVSKQMGVPHITDVFMSGFDLVAPHSNGASGIDEL